jgi:hypothetical protein
MVTALREYIPHHGNETNDSIGTECFPHTVTHVVSINLANASISRSIVSLIMSQGGRLPLPATKYHDWNEMCFALNQFIVSTNSGYKIFVKCSGGGFKKEKGALHPCLEQTLPTAKITNRYI